FQAAACFFAAAPKTVWLVWNAQKNETTAFGREFPSPGQNRHDTPEAALARQVGRSSSIRLEGFACQLRLRP
ncbi:hypothetical protein AB9F39_35795, partial [Rhizobium leguminosarum]|uniref:hypothetical protein n=1 Tax=Rhizobium leguminosarum TaxID=384 RepID=UPI003F9DEEA9